MNLDLKEQLFAENKIGQPKTASWDWEMTRTIAALYNSGGGILRVGVDDNGMPTGFHDPHDYAADKSPLMVLLHRNLESVPPFEPSEDKTHHFVTIAVKGGVT